MNFIGKNVNEEGEGSVCCHKEVCIIETRLQEQRYELPTNEQGRGSHRTHLDQFKGRFTIDDHLFLYLSEKLAVFFDYTFRCVRIVVRLYRPYSEIPV